MSRTIIVSNRLPVSIQKKGDKLHYKPSTGGLATGLGSIYKSGDNIWLGWPGMYVRREEEKKNIRAELAKENMAPVFLTKNDIEKYYEGFSNNNIWPLFHYFPQYAEHSKNLWEAYKRVNHIFADEILKLANPDDIIWIHDYQLLLLPNILREKLPNANIGFFQHIPFPSYEIFRLSPWREELLRGMLGADLIGFHTYDDMRHFLSSVSRVIGVDHTMGHITTRERMVTVDAFPMGIDYDKYAEAALSEGTKAEVKRCRGFLGSQKLILSIDRLDYSKGIPQRLKAFAEFLEKYPDYRGLVSLILLVVPSREHVPRYQALKEEIDEIVGRINGKYGKISWNPIHYFYRALPFDTLSALYSMSEVALITPLRDGMNLVCKEFLASKLDKTGVLILSEMAGSAKELSDAILINPNSEDQIVKAIHKALNMSVEEQVRHNTEMQKKLQRYNIHRWVEVFMERLQFTKKQQEEITSKRLQKETENDIISEYKNAESRLIFLDYDGTLVPFNDNPNNCKPDKELINILKELTNDPKNRVVIISGRDRDTIDNWLGHLNLDFITEHGVWLKEHENDWVLIDDLDQEWKQEVQPMLELFVDRTPGSFIETKDYSLVWHYKKAEAGLGELRARELILNLQYFTNNMDISIMEGHNVIEIKNSSVNKGKAASRWLKKYKSDFAFACGDDVTDEDTFRAMPQNSRTLKVGDSKSLAQYNIKSYAEVRALLKSMTGDQ